MNTETLSSAGRQRLLDMVRALREAQEDPHFVKDFTMHLFVNQCGTPGCALGHYAYRRDLQSMFILSKPNNDDTGLHYANAFDYHRPDRPWIRFGDDTLLNYFDITIDEAEQLFEAHGCGGARTPLAAADFIDAFVARRWPQEG